MTAWLAMLHFLRPHWFWALLALPPLWMLWRTRRRHRNVWRKQVDPHLLPHLLARSDRSVRGAAVGATLAYALAVVALAGPSWRQEQQPLWRSSAPLVLALDLSSRIGAADLPPSRLLQTRAKLARLLGDRAGGQVALVAYAGDAFTVTPLTEDPANIALFLDDLSPEVMPIDGQRADRAIEWSMRLLKQGGYDTGDILLFTDRADAAARDAASAAAAQGFRVSALGLGTPDGAAYRDAEGGIGHASRDDSSLRALASAGRGTYEVLSRDDGDLRALGVLNPRSSEMSGDAAAGKIWRDEGYWLLLPLLLLSLLAFRRGGGAAAALLLCVGLSLSMPAQAAERDWWRRPDQQQHAHIAAGAEAYRKGEFAAAEQAFTGIDTATGWYNRGNALAKQGKYDDAIAAYDQALAREPDMDDAVANRRAVEAARKRQQQGGQGEQGGGQGQQQNRSQGGDQRGKPSTSPPEQQENSGGEAKDPGSSPQPPVKPERSKDATLPRSPATPPPADPQDAKAQQAADAAQRERIRQAMAGGKGEQQKGPPSPDQAMPQESAEERERRQALETWLRRVPDEPGGLLKAKFRLEYERRQREGR